MNKVSYWMAFLSGILYFFTPCVLPLIPSFLSYITGISFQGLKSNPQRARRQILFNSLIFFLGFSLVFTSLGLGASAVGSYILGFKFPIQKIGGGIIILLGIYLIFQSRIKIFLTSRSFLPKIKPFGILGTFIVGSAFAFSWIACATPILAAVLVSAGLEAELRKGILLLMLFSLGLGIPFIFSALFFSLFLTFFQRLRKYLRVIEIIAGLVLILFGFYIFSGKYINI